MEGSSVAHVAVQYGIPFVIIRALSDLADGVARDVYKNWFKVASDNFAKIVIELLTSS